MFTFIPMACQLGELLQGAEIAWRSGRRNDAITLYDQCIQLTREIGDKGKEAEVILGKGIALLQATEDVECLKAGQSCLKEARGIAEAHGTSAQLSFIDILIENNGQLQSPHVSASPALLFAVRCIVA